MEHRNVSSKSNATRSGSATSGWLHCLYIPSGGEGSETEAAVVAEASAIGGGAPRRRPRSHAARPGDGDGREAREEQGRRPDEVGG